MYVNIPIPWILWESEKLPNSIVSDSIAVSLQTVQVLPSLKLMPVKINGWKMKFHFGARPILRGESVTKSGKS